MKCIVCNQEKEPSDEHVFPEAIGGSLVITCVCKACNSRMGHTIDCHLSGSFIVQMTMMILNVPGKDGLLKTDFYSKAVLPSEGFRATYDFDDLGKPVAKRHPFVYKEVGLSNGQKRVEIIADIRDKKKLIEAVNNKRKKLGLRPLTEAEIDQDAQVIEIEGSPQRLKFSIEFDRLSIALYKVVYELAHLWIGPEYSSDKWSSRIRTTLNGAMEGAYSMEYINNIGIGGHDGRVYDPYHDMARYNIAFLKIVKNRILAHVRIMNTLNGDFIISENADNYPEFVPMVILNNAQTRTHDIHTLTDEHARLYMKIVEGG